MLEPRADPDLVLRLSSLLGDGWRRGRGKKPLGVLLLARRSIKFFVVCLSFIVILTVVNW